MLLPWSLAGTLGTGAQCMRSSRATVPVGPWSLQDPLSPWRAWGGKGGESGEQPACFSPPDSIFKGKENKPWKTATLARAAVCSNFC